MYIMQVLQRFIYAIDGGYQEGMWPLKENDGSLAPRNKMIYCFDNPLIK